MGILIQDGTVYDGSGALPIKADILIEGERIAAIGPHLAAYNTTPCATIDAHGRVVCRASLIYTATRMLPCSHHQTSARLN